MFNMLKVSEKPKKKSDIMLYAYLKMNPNLITCEGCFLIPIGLNTMYRITNLNSIYCKKCVSKWIEHKGINPITGKSLEKNDIQLNYEVNKLIEIYTNYEDLCIKSINVNIKIDKSIELITH